MICVTAGLPPLQPNDVDPRRTACIRVWFLMVMMMVNVHSCAAQRHILYPT